MNRRLPGALPPGLLVALSLFGLMTALVVEKDHWPFRDRPRPLQLEPVRLVAEERPRPPPPPPPAVPTVTPGRTGAAPAPLSIPAPPTASAAVALPDLDIRPRLTGLPQSTGTLSGLVAGAGLGAGSSDGGDAGPGEGFQGKDLVPISSARPKYPRSAVERGIEGWVELQFLITPQGNVTDVRVLDASPRGVFEDAAVAAMIRWVYAPFYRDGRPVMREATQRLDFNTADIQPLYIWED